MSKDLSFEDLVAIFAGRASAGLGLAGDSGAAAGALPAEDRDDIDYTALDDGALVELLGGERLIAYRDAAGQESRRVIGLHGCRPLAGGGDGGDLAVLAYCHGRRAARAFRVSRIAELHDPEGGVTLNQPARIRAHFQALMAAAGQATGTAALVHRRRQALRILLFLARCDGEQHPSETAVILRYLAEAEAHAGPNRAVPDAAAPDAAVPDRAAVLDPAAVEAQLEGLQVDEIAFARALRTLRRQDPAALLQVGRAARALIAADGAVSPEEATFEAELERVLERIRPR